jgi:hypothetical protein
MLGDLELSVHVHGQDLAIAAGGDAHDDASAWQSRDPIRLMSGFGQSTMRAGLCEDADG